MKPLLVNIALAGVGFAAICAGLLLADELLFRIASLLGWAS